MGTAALQTTAPCVVRGARDARRRDVGGALDAAPLRSCSRCKQRDETTRSRLTESIAACFLKRIAVTESAAASLESKLADFSARLDTLTAEREAVAAERDEYRKLYLQTLEICRKLDWAHRTEARAAVWHRRAADDGAVADVARRGADRDTRCRPAGRETKKLRRTRA